MAACATPDWMTELRRVPRRELTMKNTQNKGSTSFVFLLVIAYMACRRYVAVKAAELIMTFRTDLIRVICLIT